MEKTNVMRILEQKKIVYRSRDYKSSGAISGVEVAAALGEDPKTVFKTLVTVGASKKNYVFVVPVEKELDLKKAAKAVGEKSVAMLKSKDLLPTTGYIHGGCSPVGMKKLFKTVVDVSAEPIPEISVSAGKIGLQITLAPSELKKAVSFDYGDITE